jgi:hypothetical protein
VVDPASHPIPRVGWYSRSCPTAATPPSPTGLSPPPVGRSSAVRLKAWTAASGRYPAPDTSFYPGPAARTSSYAAPVWAPPVSLAATPGILSVPQGTEMFQFPQCPPRHPAWYRGRPRWVAPFGNLWITRYQPVPRAFRGVVTSFIGSRRLGIHHALIFVDLIPHDDTPLPPRTTSGHEPAGAVSPTSHTHTFPTRLRPGLCPRRPGGAPSSVQPCGWTRVVRSGAAGIRTPDLRRAKAALSQLSYDPSALSHQTRPGGRAWTRTRDLGLIRTAL